MSAKINAILSALFFISFTQVSVAQDCSAILFMKQGAVLEYTDYNKKGKKESKSTHQTIAISGEQNNLTATIKTTLYDEKDKEVFDTEYQAGCKNGVFTVDMIRFFNLSKLSEQNKNDINFKIDGDVLEFPYQMKPGDQLNDGAIIPLPW